MLDNLGVTSYFRGIILALLGVVIAALGIIGVGAFVEYFHKSPLFLVLNISGFLGIDFFGAIIPLIVGSICVIIFVKFTDQSVKKITATFLLSIIFAFFLCRSTEEGVVGYPLLFSILVSTTATIVNFFTKSSNKLHKVFVSSMLLAGFCVSMILFIVDLFYSQNYTHAIIGGKGLSDGLLISMLYVPFSITGAFSAFIYVSRTVDLTKKYLFSSKLKPSKIDSFTDKESKTEPVTIKR